jgi:hypothetical protein
MAKFLRKPTIVEAEQWFPGKQVSGVTEVIFSDGPNGATKSCGYGHCVTIHGEVTKVSPGDWVITEPDGEHHYPCKDEIFRATYDPA